METDRLRAFCTIVESGSMTQAAEMLGVSHSGLSKAITSLQDELGFKVFRPAGRGLELTAEGRDVYNQSRRIIELVNELKLPKSSQGDVMPRLGVPEAIALAIGGILAKEIGPVSLDEYDTGELETKVTENQFDFGFTFIPFPRPDVEHLRIATVTLRSFHRVGAFDGVSPEKIPYVIPSSELKENALSLKIRDGWNHQLSRKIGFRTNSLAVALEMTRSGQCAIYTPSMVIGYINDRSTPSQKLEELPVPPKRRTAEASKRDIFLVKRKNEDETKMMKLAVRIVRQSCGS